MYHNRLATIQAIGLRASEKAALDGPNFEMGGATGDDLSPDDSGTNGCVLGVQ